MTVINHAPGGALPVKSSKPRLIYIALQVQSRSKLSSGSERGERRKQDKREKSDIKS